MNGDRMKKDKLFEAIVVLLLIVLVFLLYVMVTDSGPSPSGGWNLSGMINGAGDSDYGHMFVRSGGTLYTVDGEVIHAIGPDGQVRWSLEIPYSINKVRDLKGWGTPAWVQDQAVFDSGMIYVALSPSDNSATELLAITLDGKLLWSKGFSGYSYVTDLPYRPDDLDARNGLLYAKFGNNVTVYGIDGNETMLMPENIPSGLFNRSAANSNVTYSYQTVSASNASECDPYDTLRLKCYNSVDFQQEIGNRTLDQLDTLQIFANDTKTGENIWNYTLPIEKHTATVNALNYNDIMFGGENEKVAKDNTVSPQEWYSSRNITYGVSYVGSWYDVNLIPTNDTLYVSYWTNNFEVPTFFNQSNYTYAGGIYAIDNTGRLIWSEMTDSRVIAVNVNNGTLYYGTEDGKISATKMDAVAGFALTAAIYLFLRFFLAGAVTRARGRIDGNKNRNLILKFIIDNPGASLFEITRTLGMNMGTVRYHLMILAINHRIISYKADDKYVRYFTNSGSYSKEQQLIISLMRREGIHKVLNKLLEKPGISNMELANDLGVLDSSTIRQMKELLSKGI